MSSKHDDFNHVPEDIIRHVLEYLPCEPQLFLILRNTLSLNNKKGYVSKAFKIVADEDMAWQRMLFSKYQSSQRIITKNYKWVYEQATKYSARAQAQLKKELGNSCWEHKIVIGGAGGVGCSAVVIQFMQGVFIEEYDPTIEDSYYKEVVLDGFKTGLDLLDTAGQEEYKALRDSYMRNYQSFIFLFSVTSRQSFNEVQEWVEQVRRVKDTKNVPIILSANKIDLVNDRVVTTQEGEELAKALDVEYFEVSAKDREACTELYYKAARMARDTMTEVHELWETLEKGKIPSIKSAKKKCNVM